MDQAFKGQFDLTGHAGHTEDGITIRILALTAVIWHDGKIGDLGIPRMAAR